MVEVLEFVVAKLPWVAVGFLAGVGTRVELTRVTIWAARRRLGASAGDRRRGRAPVG